jgi:hypothetical protein
MLDLRIGRIMAAFFVRSSIVTVGAALVLATAACGTSDPIGIGGNNNGNNGTTQAEYDLAVKKWQTSGPVHYRIVVQQTCECSTDLQRPTRVTVRRTPGQSTETIEEVVDAQTLADVSLERKTAAKSVDGLLVLISQALQLNPQESRITYDSTLGYPISINIDPVTSIPGDEFVYKITSFETLP